MSPPRTLEEARRRVVEELGQRELAKLTVNERRRLRLTLEDKQQQLAISTAPASGTDRRRR
jgi:hypothetical protein